MYVCMYILVGVFEREREKEWMRKGDRPAYNILSFIISHVKVHLNNISFS